jgi:hypothetical protein
MCLNAKPRLDSAHHWPEFWRQFGWSKLQQFEFFSGSFYKVSITFAMGNRSEQLNAQARAMVEETKELELTWWWELDVSCLSPPTRGIV